VLDAALAALPGHARPGPDNPEAVTVLVRTDSAAATHEFARACRARGVGFSFRFAVDHLVQHAVDLIPAAAWAPAIQTDGIRDGARGGARPPTWLTCPPGRPARG
jgi:hypothetical protein